MSNVESLELELLAELCEIPGIPGFEHRVRDYISQQVEGYVDELYTDPMGNLHAVKYARKKKKAQTVMLACHMDEIGFIVNYIDEKGFVYVQPLGGFDPRNLFSRRVLVSTYEGDYRGVMNPAGLPVHMSKPEDRKKVPAADEFVIDLGFDANEAVNIGDMVTMDEPFAVMGDKLVSKALDNRVACYLGIQALAAMDSDGATHNTHVVFTVQEEVGLRGAKTSAMIVKPDIAIGVDVTLSCDTPGVPANKHVTTQGSGFALGIRDASFIADPSLVKEFRELAEELDIDYQAVVSAGGGMDGAAMQQAGKGARAIAISVGTRYIHTVTEMVDANDLASAQEVLCAYLTR